MQRANQSANFEDFLCAHIKIYQILVILKQEMGFSSNFPSIFSIKRHNSSVLFQLNFIYFQQEELIKVQIW